MLRSGGEDVFFRRGTILDDVVLWSLVDLVDLGSWCPSYAARGSSLKSASEPFFNEPMVSGVCSLMSSSSSYVLVEFPNLSHKSPSVGEAVSLYQLTNHLSFNSFPSPIHSIE